MVVTRIKGGGGRKEDQIHGDGKWFDFGWWAYNVIYRSYIIEIYTCYLYTLLSNVTPIDF